MRDHERDDLGVGSAGPVDGYFDGDEEADELEGWEVYRELDEKSLHSVSPSLGFER